MKIQAKTFNQVIQFQKQMNQQIQTEKDSFFWNITKKKEKENTNDDEYKARRIAMKIARGDDITAEEKEFLLENDAQLYYQAVEAKREGERIKREISSAKTTEEAKEVLSEANMKVCSVSKGNEVFGELIAEAVKGACKKVSVNKPGKDSKSVNAFGESGESQKGENVKRTDDLNADIRKENDEDKKAKGIVEAYEEQMDGQKWKSLSDQTV